MSHRLKGFQRYVSQSSISSFFLVRRVELSLNARVWQTQLPRVKPFYAVKCNPFPLIINQFVDLKLGFDCASENEISQVLALGANPSSIIFANPVKTPTQILNAKEAGVNCLTFDSLDELEKFKIYHPKAQLILRISVDDSKARHRIGQKYGASKKFISPLLQYAKSQHLDLVGVSFHVGSPNDDPKAYTLALQQCKEVFNLASMMGLRLRIVDIGGGFSQATFNVVARVVREKLDALFPNCDKVEIMAEPGRFLVENAATLAVRIIGKRQEDGIIHCTSSIKIRADMRYHRKFGVSGL